MTAELGNHTLRNIDRQLVGLLHLILDMGARVRELAVMSRRALEAPSDALVAEARAIDKHINTLEIQLEDAATATLALQNPLAVDLRFVTTSLKVSGILERAGDLAKNTVKRAAQLDAAVSPDAMVKLKAMADAVLMMLDSALEAVRERDAQKAIEVWKHDDAVDALYRAVFDVALADMAAHPERIPSCTHVMFMAKNLERMADYVSNLAKTVYYVATGKAPDKSLVREKREG